MISHTSPNDPDVSSTDYGREMLGGPGVGLEHDDDFLETSGGAEDGYTQILDPFISTQWLKTGGMRWFYYHEVGANSSTRGGTNMPYDELYAVCEAISDAVAAGKAKSMWPEEYFTLYDANDLTEVASTSFLDVYPD
jgi:hypothetical protein